MLDRDPPDHTRLRSLVTKVFTRRAIAALEPKIVGLVDAALDRMAEKGESDLVEELAFPLPFAVISEMLGMPPTDHSRIRELSGTLVRSLEIVADEETARAIMAADAELTAITREVIAWKRDNPADDLLTALIAAEHDGQVLDGDELVAQVVLLYVAGHETTVNLIANGVNALLRNPSQLAFAARPAGPGGERGGGVPAVRLPGPADPPRHDVPVRGGGQARSRRGRSCWRAWGRRTVTSGSSARTPRSCDWTGRRPVTRCRSERARTIVLGAALARLEGQVAVSRLVQRFPGLGFAGELEWNGRINLRGPAKFPVTVKG